MKQLRKKNRMKHFPIYLKNKIFIILSLFCFSFVQAKDFQRQTFVHNGIKRNYLLHLPNNSNQNNASPLIIVLHGGHGTAKGMIKLTYGAFNTLADKENCIVVYPNGIKKNWNDGRQQMPESYIAHNQNIDDVGFIETIIDIMIKTYHADPSRVYISGMSNGAIMTERLAIELYNKIAAAAPVCGNIAADLHAVPKHPVAMLLINGNNDPLVPYEGGNVHFFKKQLGKVVSAKESAQFWVQAHNIKSNPQIITLANTDPYDNCTASETVWGNNAVVLLTIENGGHTWPGGLQYLGKRLIGNTCRDFNASELIWEFFKAHTLAQ
jgi:polyhydroxybutyrate depolymerase